MFLFLKRTHQARSVPVSVSATRHVGGSAGVTVRGSVAGTALRGDENFLRPSFPTRVSPSPPQQHPERWHHALLWAGAREPGSVILY